MLVLEYNGLVDSP